MTLSGWALDRHHRAMAGTSDEAARLAIALGAARSTIRVIDRSSPPMAVDWAGGISATDFTHGIIHLNPDPVLKNDPDALDLVAAFGMHEASHSQESRSRWRSLMRPGPDGTEVPAFEPLRLAAWLWNLVEDVRIEAATSRRWPGFRRYFTLLVEWLWGHQETPFMERPYAGGKMEDKLALVFATCRFPGRVAYDSDRAVEAAWWHAWQAAYLDESVDTETTIRSALDHLREDEDAAAELDQMAADEQAEREAGEKLRRQIERLIAEGIKGAPMPCAPGEVHKVRLDSQTAQQVKQLIAEHLEQHVTIIAAQGAANPPLRVRRPTEDASSRRAYVGPPSGEVAAMRDGLVFRASAPEWTEKLLKAGEIDDEELYRLAAGDERVFSQRVIEAKPDVLLGLLVDLSGSMHGEKLAIAQRLAQVFVWSLHDAEGVETRVWGHTANTDEDEADVFRIWEPADPMSRLGLISSLPHMNNADGHAIAYCARQMMDREQPEKVLVVLSDGLPHAHGYGNEAAMAHIRTVCRWAASRGVRVIQIAIDPDDLRPEDQNAMFGDGNWVGYTDQASLPRHLAGVLARWS